MRLRHAQAWFRLLPSLQAAYLAAAGGRLSSSAASTPSSSPSRGPSSSPSGTRTVLVGMHHRSVKRRRLSNAIYMRVVTALRKRHEAYLSAHPASRLRLAFVIHSDSRLSSEQRNSSGGMLPTLGRMRDVTLRTPHEGTSGAGRDALHCRLVFSTLRLWPPR